MNGKGCRVLCPPNKTKKKERKPLCTIITQTVCVIYTFQPAFHRHRWDEGTKGGGRGACLQPPQTTDTDDTFIGSGSFSSARLSSIPRLFACFAVLASASDFSLKHAVVTLLLRLAASLSIPAPRSVHHTMKISLHHPPDPRPRRRVCVHLLDTLSIILCPGRGSSRSWPIVPVIVLYLLYGMLVPTPTTTTLPMATTF